MSFQIALSGLNAATTDLEVTGNNIANANTNGFKESRIEYSDVYANSLQDEGANSGGRGVEVSRVAQQFAQGSVDFTSNNLDLAINGEGFFVLEDTNGTTKYTRAGAYSADRNGNVVNANGDKLQIYPAVTGSDGATTFTPGVLQSLQLPLSSNAPSATTEVSAQLNLSGSETTPLVAFDTASPDPSSYNYSTSMTAYDSLGATHTGTLYFVKDSTPNQWSTYFFMDGTNVTSGGSPYSTLTFDSSGGLSSPATGTISLDSFSPSSAAASMDLTLDLSGSTQYGTEYSINNLDQDGYASGRLSGVDIDNQGVVFARYTNGESTTMGKVAMGNFNNPQGLRAVGGSQWVETNESGTVRLGEAGTGNFGLMQSGALESSNVDIATELVDLIIAQRNYQANAKAISTNNQVTQSVINI
jgi:flagellar hook protein FlgE